MGTSSVLLMIASSLILLEVVMTSSTEVSKSKELENLVEVLRCFKDLKESGQRTYVTYIGSQMRLFDDRGREVSCDAEKQQEIRQRSDRRCIFSPIHCLFDRRLQTAKLLRSGTTKRLFGERRRR
ncbi:neuronal small secreted protein [Caenorhabditis elegans]|uniref:Neuronal small secreted protein nssp-22 n=1 Tax=Caenorhabditis elegans TaxID=6239 RepID=YRV9_CAEEL|nr:Uncharacterized protein CELE_T10B9.9 [Caenorhabditis elegans]Q09352.2 RecName: Full=Uncharacterized protein T10B9.29; Flags: Precursor [Caenorhabditis elegans]CAA88608.2 Uncharacterized protein CELE_T10B9.9 [Caenorhabditis elegans]|eukprot:NP_496107.2 Uncharacterized protein CELE_T10B9.9 [Caenorhabditis elegans]